MKVFRIEFDVFNDESKEVTREQHFWTAPSLFAATAAASADAYEYEKTLIAVVEACIIVRQVDFKEGQKKVEACINYELLEGEGIE